MSGAIQRERNEAAWKRHQEVRALAAARRSTAAGDQREPSQAKAAVPLPLGEQLPTKLLEVVRAETVAKAYSARGNSGSRGGGNVFAVRHASITVSAGEFVAIMGRSGCGKTTLLNLLGAMDIPTSGAVWLLGQKTSALSDDELTRLRRNTVGFVFQFFNLLPTISAVENVEMPLLLAGGTVAREARARALTLLEQVGLADRAHDFPHRLAGGEMQRVAIARALINEPKLVIADEPTGNLDSATAQQALERLSTLCRERDTAVIMATHSADAASVAGRRLHMADGVLAEK